MPVVPVVLYSILITPRYYSFDSSAHTSNTSIQQFPPVIDGDVLFLSGLYLEERSTVYKIIMQEKVHSRL